jgi:hypothetical protein
MGFERHVLDRGRAEGVFEYEVGFSEAALYISMAQLEVATDIAAVRKVAY